MKRMIMVAFALLGLSAWSIDGTWTNLTTGVWTDATQWHGGVIGGGAGSQIGIMPGFGGARPDDRFLQVPDEGVTVGTLQYQAGNPMGAIRIWGGPLTFDNGGYATITGPGGSSYSFCLLARIEGTDTIQFSDVTLATHAAHTGDTVVSGKCNIFGNTYADFPSLTTTNQIPNTRLILKAGAQVDSVSRGSWDPFSANFMVTEGSRQVVCETALSKGIGAAVTGEGIPPGTWLKAAITEFVLELSQPATATGTFTLEVAGAPAWRESLQQLNELALEGYGSLMLSNHINSNNRWEVGELTGHGTFAKNGNGMLSIGVGNGFSGTVAVSGPVTFNKVTEDSPTLDDLQLGGGTVSIPDAEMTLSAGILSVNGKVVKTGSGTLAASSVSVGGLSSELDVKEGSMVLGGTDGIFAASPVRNAWFHVDASRADTLTTVEEGGVTYVTRWNDADGGPIFATAGTRPFVNTNALPGHTVIDFGSFHYPTQGVDGYGGFMDWSETDGAIREVFMVFSDTDDIADIPDRLAGSFLLGDSDTYQFHRGVIRSLFIAFTADAIRNGLIQVDGETRAFDYPLPAGFHLIHLRTTGNVRANAFARDRGFSWGGQRIAEALIFNRQLSEAEAELVADYLKQKWFGDSMVKLVDRFDVSGQSTITVPDGGVLGVGTLSVDGRVEKRGEGGFAADAVFISGTGVVSVAEGILKGGTNTTSSVFGELEVADGAGVGANPETTLDVMAVNGSGTFVKEGGGTVNLYGLSGGITTLDVRDGSLAFPQGTMPSGAWFHVDASRADTLTTVEEDGVTYVTRWNDADGGPVFATAGTRPFLNTTALPGHTVIDVGSYHYPAEGVQGYGGYMDWNATDTAIREVFMVVSDTDDIADIPDRITGNFLLGDSDAYQFHRGLNRSLFIMFTADAIRNGLIQIDGMACGSEAPLPAGFHLVHLRTTGNVRANAFARNRGLSWGGQRIAEVIIYNRELTDAEAHSASLYLTGKWRSSGIPAEHTFDTLQVAENATLDVGERKVTAADVNCLGTIRAASFSADRIHLTSDGANLSNFVLDGRFAATEPGTIIVDGDMLPKVKHDDFVFATVTGCDDVAALSRWRVEGDAIPKGWSAQLALVDGNRLAVRLFASGLLILVD